MDVDWRDLKLRYYFTADTCSPGKDDEVPDFAGQTFYDDGTNVIISEGDKC